MRIVCTVTNDLSHDQRMHRICSTLAGAGHEVTLVGRSLPTSSKLSTLPYQTHRITCHFHAGKAFYLEYNFRLALLLRRWQYDVLCSVDLDTMIAGSWLQENGTKWVFDAHEWFSETPEVVNRPLIRRFWRQLGRRLAHRCDARYTVGLSIARKLQDDYGCAFEVIRNLPDKSIFTKKEITGGVILYQGMLNPGRGLDHAILALVRLPDHQLWIVGGGPERSSLEALAAEKGVTDRVRFIGYVQPADIPAYTAQAWLGLNLLDGSSPSYYYSLANKALDYLRAGLPSLQMNFPEYRRIDTEYDCFILLPELSADKIVSAVMAISEDPERYDRLATNARRAGEDLCWENEAPKLLAIYERLG